MKRIALLLTVILMGTTGLALADIVFGQYQTSPEFALQQRIQNQRIVAQRKAMMEQRKRYARRGIEYPSPSNPYPSLNHKNGTSYVNYPAGYNPTRTRY